MTEGRLNGDTLRFQAGDDEYQVKVSGKQMEGQANGQTGWKAALAG